MSDLEAFYVQAYPRLVGQVALLTASRPEAEEVVQDAVVRLIPRWDKVAAYDDPEAWLRRVAFRLAVSRWRRGRVAAAGVLRLRPAEPVPGPTGEDVDLVRALAQLSLPHREVLVLHHVCGLTVEECSDLLGVAVGTVKSRLSRGRSALASLLDTEVMS